MIKTIASFPQLWEADMVVSLLRWNGLHPAELEISPHVMLAGADQGFFVRVPEEEFPESRDLLIRNGYAKNLTET